MHGYCVLSFSRNYAIKQKCLWNERAAHTTDTKMIRVLYHIHRIHAAIENENETRI